MFIESLNELKKSLDLCESRKEFIAIAKNIRLNESHFSEISTWSSGHYTRNCVFRSDKYELLLLCWEPGQDTPIHCHDGEECWVYLVKGAMREFRFRFPDHSTPEMSHNQLFKAGQVAYINDELGVHRLRNESAERSLTLHLYVGPIDKCRVFDDQTGEYVWKDLIYDTVSQTV